MTTVGSSRMRWVSLFGLLMLLLSVTPTGLAAQVGLTPVGDIAQEGEAPMGAGIEVLLFDCEPGTPQDSGALTPGCTDGRAGIDLQVTSTNPANGINLPKTSVKPSDPGPGVINTGDVPEGEYRVDINLPVEDNQFFFECRTRGADTNNVSVRPVDGAPNAFLVNNSVETDVVCQVWITPAGENPVMEITYRECDRSAMPSDSRSFEDLDTHCTTISTNPPTINVRPAGVSGDPATPHQFDAQGVLELTLQPGDYDMFTDLNPDQWGEYLFCEYEGQPRYQKDFSEVGHFTTFTNLLPGEEFTCDWFGVSAAELETEGPEEAPVVEDDLETEDPVQNESETAQQEANEPENDQAQNESVIVPQQEAAGVTFNIDFNECTRGDLAGDDRSFEQLRDNCTYFTAPGPTFTIQEQDFTQSTQTLEADGTVTFTHPAADFSIFTGLPVTEWGEYLFCEYEGQPLYQKPFTAEGVNGFSNLVDGEVIDCYWFAVNASETPTEGQQVDPTVQEPTPATFTLTMLACQSEEAVGDTASIDAFRANCTAGVENMVMNLVNQNDERLGGVTLPTGEATIGNVPAGDWRLWSEIPLEAATEYYFCSVDGGAYAQMPLSDRGVASFPGIDGQQIDCEIYVVPENLRGEVTGSSVEIHLSLCPANYSGSSWYNDCHANGLDGYDFTLIGPAGEVTANTVVERTPGPGIVRFVSLPAGEYQLRGGPPLHDGEVFLYCSDPSTNQQVETAFEDGHGWFLLNENQSIVCDWYFVPTGEAPEPEPTPVPTRAEIFTTMFICPPDVNVAGSTFSQLDSACSERLSDVPMTLQSPGGVPITANTGVSGEGAVRFYDLIGGDYVLTPKLPAEYVSAAVYCDLDGGNVYQKALANGATTFVNVDGELISCSWFVTAKPQPAPGPTGSITIREMLCEGDRSTIKDWERECRPGSSGVSFTITSSGGGVNQTLTPNAEGVAVFTGLPNEYYDVKQSEGAWCRAKAERVDAQSRVIVSGGGNTDLFIYQCNQQIGLPETGTGSMAGAAAAPGSGSLMMGAAGLPMIAFAAWYVRRSQLATNGITNPARVHELLSQPVDGYREA